MIKWLANMIDRSFKTAFEGWYLNYHSRYPQMLSDEQIDHLKTVKLCKVNGHYVNLDVYYEFEAFKAGRSMM